MWNPQRELVKHASIIATDKHPEGYNKQQLIAASTEVFGGYATNPVKEVKTHEQATNYANYLSEIDGGYPRGLSTCFAVGISGNCGVDCDQFTDGNCESPEFELDEILDTHGEEEGIAIADRYGEFEDELNKRFPLET